MEIDNIQYQGNDYLLFRLKYFLNFQLSSSILFPLLFFYRIGLIIIVPAALIFTPYMFYVLYRTKRYGWMWFFLITVIIPSIISLLIDITSHFTYVFLLIELGIFYFNCFILRFVINDWCEEINSKMIRIEKEKESAEKEKLFQKYLDNR